MDRAALQILDRAALQRAGKVDLDEAGRRWRQALARPGHDDEPTLVALLEEWSAHSGLDYREMLTRILTGQETVDREWEELAPATADEVAAFYDKTETILPLLLWWHGTDITPARCAASAMSVLAAVGAKRLLDFGSGIGSTALVAASEGVDVILSDVSREVLGFAEFRMQQRGYRFDTLDLLEGSIDQLGAASVDAAISFDVFEHLPAVDETLRQLDRVLSPGGVLCFNQAFVPEHPEEPEHYPQHGEVLVALAERGYRLAHVRDVMWVAQKAALAPAEQRRQSLELQARIVATKAVERRQGPVGRRLAFHVIRNALS